MADDPETALFSELERALLNFSITNADETALSILNYSAQLTPDDAQRPISTTRLFAGVVAAGQSLVSQNATALGSYAAAVALALAKNSVLQAKYQDSIAALFKTEPPESALVRLRPKWFSNNVTKILGEAAKADRSTPLTFSELKMPTIHCRALSAVHAVPS
jgi:hypothetical protein